MVRTPKPPDRESTPRHRERKLCAGGGHRSAYDKLSALAAKPSTHEDNEEYQAQVLQQTNDRGAVLLASANVENVLELTITKFLVYERARTLTRLDWPLGSFRNKIYMAYAMDMFGDHTFSNLETIRHLRNAFAHAKVPISFKTPEVDAVCNLLDVHPLYLEFMQEIAPASTKLKGRQRFLHACQWIGNRLMTTYIAGRIKIDPQALRVSLPSDCEYIEARPKPLP